VSFVASLLAKLLAIVQNPLKIAPWHENVIQEVLQLTPLANAYSKLDLNLLHKVLESILTLERFPETTIIIDALSECRDCNADALLDFLHHISHLPKLKLIVFSRNDLRIKSRWKIVMNKEKIQQDVKLYAKSRINRCPWLRKIGSQILDRIPEDYFEIFLATKLLLDELEAAETSEDQMEILELTPPSLSEHFKRLWDNEEFALSARKKQRRLEIFSMLVAAREPLTVDEISHFLALDTSTNTVQNNHKLNDPLKTVETLCRPFVVFVGRRVEIAHPPMRDFLSRRFTREKDPNLTFAEKCLSKLSEEPFASVPYAAALQRKHLLPAGILGDRKIGVSEDEEISYKYAALHWPDHTTAINDPPDSFLLKLSEFISSVAAVTWSEELVDIKGGSEATTINVQIDVRTLLADWAHSLPPHKGAKVPVHEFFVASHEKLRQKLEENGEDHLLPYLPAVRLGQFYSIGGMSDEDYRKAYDYKKTVVDGFTRYLGKRSPLTLKARTTWVNEFFSRQLIAQAETELLEISSIQKEVSGEDSLPYLEALQLLGSAQYCLTKFGNAFISLEESGRGLLRLLGSEKWAYQVNDLYRGWVLERQGATESALKMYDSILQEWAPIGGEKNGLSLMARTSLGSVYRKQHEYDQARVNLVFAWEARLKLFSIHSNTTVDSGIQLATTLREMKHFDDSLELLDQIEMSTVFEKDFERECQATHLRALIKLDRGESHEPQNDLSRILDETIGDKRDQNNRECLWIRTTLADALKYEGRFSEALMLFSEIVKPIQGDSSSPSPDEDLKDEPEPPNQLAIAEEALRRVKRRDQAGAEELLRLNGLQWVRQQDFWIRQGGPPTDTAWMKAVDH
jgi:tetratricopeptide (TPR) repeat protein